MNFGSLELLEAELEEFEAVVSIGFLAPPSAEEETTLATVLATAAVTGLV